MALKESGEMYLETILILSQEKKHVRAIDIANERDFSRASVSRALSLLKDSGHVEIDEDDFITLTDKGMELANEIYNRHLVLSEIFQKLGVDEEQATTDACKIEHHISSETFNAIKKHFGYK